MRIPDPARSVASVAKAARTPTVSSMREMREGTKERKSPWTSGDSFSDQVESEAEQNPLRDAAPTMGSPAAGLASTAQRYAAAWVDEEPGEPQQSANGNFSAELAASVADAECTTHGTKRREVALGEVLAVSAATAERLEARLEWSVVSIADAECTTHGRKRREVALGEELAGSAMTAERLEARVKRNVASIAETDRATQRREQRGVGSEDLFEGDVAAPVERRRPGLEAPVQGRSASPDDERAAPWKRHFELASAEEHAVPMGRPAARFAAPVGRNPAAPPTARCSICPRWGGVGDSRGTIRIGGQGRRRHESLPHGANGGGRCLYNAADDMCCHQHTNCWRK